MTDSFEIDPRQGRRLDGWKEIANYLGRGVRTAQRWEEYYGLPVRRHGQGKSAAVFALEHELSDWLVTSAAEDAQADTNGDASSHAAAPAAPATAAQPGPPTPPPSTLAPTRRWVFALVLVIVAGIVAASWYFIRKTQAPATVAAAFAAGPATARVDIDSLIVANESGVELWRTPFPPGLRPEAYGGTFRLYKTLVQDVDGDGAREVLFIPQLRGNAPTGPLTCFNANGTVRWQYEFKGGATFGSDEFLAPYRIHGIAITQAPEDPRRFAMWAVSHHNTWYPSVVERLDLQTGRPTSTYWSDGYISAVELVRRNDQALLYVGAADNELKAASLAELDAMHPTGSAPAFADKYRCKTCPAGAPRAFIVFPKPARFAGMDTCGSVERIDTMDQGDLFVRVIHALSPIDPSNNAVAIYRLADMSTPLLADVADGYLSAYRALTEQGLLKGGFPAAGLVGGELFPLLAWDGSKFAALPRAQGRKSQRP